MGRLQLYLSHSAHDQALAERLAWTLREAEADIWFDVHVQDSSLPAQATQYELEDHRVLVLV